MSKPGKSPTANDADKGNEFERFEELVKNIISVPKSTIDKARETKTA